MVINCGTLTLENVAIAVNYCAKFAGGAYVIKLFTVVIYCHCITLLSFCVIKFILPR